MSLSDFQAPPERGYLRVLTYKESELFNNISCIQGLQLAEVKSLFNTECWPAHYSNCYPDTQILHVAKYNRVNPR
jgi:hypothetical protein